MVAESTDAALEEAVRALPRKKMSGKKLVLFVILPLLLLAGGGAALYASGILDMLMNPAARQETTVDRTKPGFFYDLPEMIVDLNIGDRRRTILQVQPTLELNHEEDVAKIEPLIPRILDSFQAYLRELRADDLRGSAGPHRLREELLRRVNAAVHPLEVREVLFSRFLLSS